MHTHTQKKTNMELFHLWYCTRNNTQFSSSWYLCPQKNPFWMKLIGLHHKTKTAVKSTKATQITISYKHMMLIYKEKSTSLIHSNGNGPYESTVVRMQQ